MAVVERFTGLSFWTIAVVRLPPLQVVVSGGTTVFEMCKIIEDPLPGFIIKLNINVLW